MDGAIKFQLFYFTFLLLTLFFISTYSPTNNNILKNLNKADLAAINNVPAAPTSDPLTIIVYPFQVAYGFITKLFVLCKISSEIAILSTILTAFSLIEVFIIISTLRG